MEDSDAIMKPFKAEANILPPSVAFLVLYNILGLWFTILTSYNTFKDYSWSLGNLVFMCVNVRVCEYDMFACTCASRY